MDFNSLDLDKLASDGVKVELTHPGTGEPLTDDNGDALYIVCLGRDSKKWKAAAKRIRAASTSKKADSVEGVDKMLVKVMAECTTEWADSIELDGEQLECTRDNAENLYTRFGWVAEQVLAKVTNREALFLEQNAS